MRKVIAILIMFLLAVQTVQFGLSAASDDITASISLDEEKESGPKELKQKKESKEYSAFHLSGLLAGKSGTCLSSEQTDYFPLPPYLRLPTPPPDLG